MEAHHHSHLASGETHTSRKKWTHYFWEFLTTNHKLLQELRQNYKSK